MVFKNEIQFRRVIVDYTIERIVQMMLKPSEKNKRHVRYKVEGCERSLVASIDKESTDFRVKTYKP